MWNAIGLLICCCLVALGDTTVKTRDTDIEDGQKRGVRRATYYRRDAMRRKDSFFGDDPTPLTIEIVSCTTRMGFLSLEPRSVNT